jgi:hypothetical protein
MTVLFFVCFAVCFVCSVFLYCFVYVSTYVYKFLFSLCIVYGPMPLSENPIAVNRYHIILQKSLLDAWIVDKCPLSTTKYHENTLSH